MNTDSNCRLLDAAWFAEHPLPEPSSTADKEAKGRALVVAGSREMPGAAWLASTAALRAGVGKLTLLTVESAADAIAIAIPEARVVAGRETPAGAIDASGIERLGTAAERMSAVLIGPGLVGGQEGGPLARGLFRACGEAPMVLDADAMDLLAIAHEEDASVLITPHAGELAHLTGAAREDIEADPFGAAVAASKSLGADVLLKGATSVLATREKGALWFHESREPGLGASGSGDVLAGIIVGLLARGADMATAAAWAVAVHARCGARLATRVGSLGYLARELTGEIPPALEDIKGRS